MSSAITLPAERKGASKIIFFLKDYIQSHFNAKLYGLTALLLIAGIWVNYAYDFEDGVIDAYRGQEIRILWYFLFQGLPYYTVCAFVYFCTDKKDFVRKKGFWLATIFAFAILGFNRAFHYHFQLLEIGSLPWAVKVFWVKNVRNLSKPLVVVLPLLVFYWWHDREKVGHFYGFRKDGVDWKPYLIMLAIMVPLVVGASFSESFLQEYPTYKRARGPEFSAFYGISESLAFIIHEIDYAWSFITVEVFFRGFLIFALARYLGDEVVLPMVATYCFLHFGKPLGETISSIFGGYILGIVALRTNNIWGGVMVHMGIAVLMDVCAFGQMQVLVQVS